MKYVNRDEFDVELVAEDTVDSKIKYVADQNGEEAFFVVDLGKIVRKYKLWKLELPHVEPYYAVKCNDDLAVLDVLCRLGTGFDCASKSEIKKVLNLGVSPSRIIYANPCKQNSFIKYAKQVEVSMMTFDNELELQKIKAHHPHAEVILRIIPPDESSSQCQIGMKYGCHPSKVSPLLKLAHELQLNVIGISFHVGSNCQDPGAFAAAVKDARSAYDEACAIGFKMNLLDIGGGFPGDDVAKVTFEEICIELRDALQDYFPRSLGVRLIAEPGRFFVASAFSLVTNVIAKRNSDSESGNIMYYVNDGVYGSFNCILYDHQKVVPTLLKTNELGLLRKSSIWGPTCDGLDCIMESCMLPELNLGQWIIFHNMGAYTLCARSNFNGMPSPAIYYIMSETNWLKCSLAKIESKSMIPMNMKTGLCNAVGISSTFIDLVAEN